MIYPHNPIHTKNVLSFIWKCGLWGFIHSWEDKGYAKNEQYLHNNKHLVPILPIIQIRVQDRVLPIPACIFDFSIHYSQSSVRLGYKYRVHKSLDVF